MTTSPVEENDCQGVSKNWFNQAGALALFS